MRKSAKMKKAPARISSVALLIAVLPIFLALSCCSSSSGQGSWKDIEIGEVDPSSLADGTYEGEHESGPVKAVVAVEVSGGKILGIELVEHRNLLGKKAERQIPSRVVAAQSVKVDAVTRATASSLVILKAIEIALTR